MVSQKSRHMPTNWILIVSLSLISDPIVITLNLAHINELSTLTAFSLKTKPLLEWHFINVMILLYIYFLSLGQTIKRKDGGAYFFPHSPSAFQRKHYAGIKLLKLCKLDRPSLPHNSGQNESFPNLILYTIYYYV
jgi:hypothetical protein